MFYEHTIKQKDHNMCSSVLEAIGFLLTISAITGCLCVNVNAVYVYICLILCVGCSRITKTFDQTFITCFNVIKFITILGSFIAINVIRYNTILSESEQNAMSTILAINMIEAIIKDIFNANYFNALSGIILVLLIPCNLPTNVTTTITNGWIPFNLSPVWIVIYTTWNAAFSYTENFPWTTRLILIPPLLISIICGPEYWFCARTYSIFLHPTMCMIQLTKYYVPGKTSLTPPINSVVHNSSVAIRWGILNAIMSVVYFTILYNSYE